MTPEIALAAPVEPTPNTPDIAVRNRLKGELGRNPTREEVAAAIGGTVVAKIVRADIDITNHISYAAGHCTAWMEVYCASQGLVAGHLIAGVTEVLKRGGK